MVTDGPIVGLGADVMIVDDPHGPSQLDELADGALAAIVNDVADPPRKARRSPQLTVVTDSELQTWRSCPQLHHFKYRERLRPNVDAKALALGSIFHAGMRDGIAAGWSTGWRSRSNVQRLADEIEAAQKSIDDLVMKWTSKRVAHEHDLDFDALEKETEQAAAMVKWMLKHYFESTTEDLLNLVLVETEKNFNVDLHDRRGRVLPYLRYAGVRDATFFDPAYNQLVLAEHKTSGGRPQDIEKRVEMDTQTAGYIYALTQQRANMKTVDGVSMEKAHVGRVIYNVLRKSYPKPPKVNKDGTVSVAACVTTPELYLAAIKDQVEQRKLPMTEKQKDFFESLKTVGDPFFARVDYHRTKDEIERWRQDTVIDAGRVRLATYSPEHRTRNTGHCNMPWSLPCPYRSVCLDDQPELRSTFRVVDNPHVEVREAEGSEVEP